MKINIINANSHTPSKKINNYINSLFLTKRKKEINIKITNAKQIKTLNKKYKNNNKSTDMLTFKNKKTPNKNIGDIVLCPKIMKQNFKKNHWETPIIHSMLHIINYNHLEKKDAIIMLKIENKFKELGMSGIEPPTITTSK